MVRWFTELTQHFTVRRPQNKLTETNSNNTTIKQQKRLLKNKSIKVYLEMIKMSFYAAFHREKSGCNSPHWNSRLVQMQSTHTKDGH